MKALTQSVLAAAMLVAFPFAAAEACTINAWNGNTSAASGTSAAGPTTGQRRYSESCSLSATAGQFVTDNTPAAEATYQVRFYVFTGGTGKIFSATTANSNGGSEVFGVSYNGTAFTFSGASGVAPINAAPNRWYSVTATNVNGGSFSVSVQGNNAATATTGTGTAGTGLVESASLGLIGAGTGALQFDSFESVRSTTPIARLCRGDTNNDGARTIADAGRIRNEFLNPATSATSGQPDYDENGAVTIADAGLVQNLFLAGQGACPSS
ncbi:dockerin type I domain-containing protein [uncultured Aquimonas sp.]|uniref:dockerin type I domain-containing protein n=1 Tax=uncultured Aquimonas sp. TaxID=385483 RepID=UPI00262AB777|nr:dockerin type I domain-containing protein [uncultured Aquimonas sp.]